MENAMKTIVMFLAGLLIGASLFSANAHTPCNNMELKQQCKYVLTTDPYTGETKSEYVCP